MSEWVETKLGEVIERRTDFTPVDPDAAYVILGVQRSGWGFVQRDPIFGRDQKFKKLLQVAQNDLVYRTITAFEAPAAVAGEAENGRFVTPQTFPVFRLDQASVLPGYARLLTTWPGFHHEMAIRCSGTVQRRKTLAIGAFSDIPILLPPLGEQRRIVDVMAAVDGQIGALEAELKRSSALRVRIVLDTADITVQISSVAAVSQGKSLPKASQGRQSGDVSWFKIADMTGRGNHDGYTLADTRLLATEIKALKGVIVGAGSVVFPRVGAAVLTEKKRILDVDGAVDENHLVLTPKEGVSSEYLLGALESIRLGDFVQTGAVPSLNMGLIRSARIPWSDESSDVLDPPLGMLRRTVREARNELARLRSFRPALLTALLNQHISIPESYDELMDRSA